MPTEYKPPAVVAVCFVIAVFGGGLAALGAFQAADCQVADNYNHPNNPCTVNSQITANASIAFGLVGLIFAVGAVAFQIGHLKSPSAAPSMPFPMSGAPPYPGPVPPPQPGPTPPPHQGLVPPPNQGPTPPPPPSGRG